ILRNISFMRRPTSSREKGSPPCASPFRRRPWLRLGIVRLTAERASDFAGRGDQARADGLTRALVVSGDWRREADGGDRDIAAVADGRGNAVGAFLVLADFDCVTRRPDDLELLRQLRAIGDRVWRHPGQLAGNHKPAPFARAECEKNLAEGGAMERVGCPDA